MQGTGSALTQHDILRRRLPVVVVVLLLVSGYLLVQLASFQYLSPDVRGYLESVSEANYSTVRRLTGERGAIYDRDGEPLAVNMIQYDASISPSLVADPLQTSRDLARILGRSEVEIFDLITSDNLWEDLGRVDADAGDQLADLGLLAIRLDPVWLRRYPQGPLAAQVLGFVNLESRGFYGVEGEYDPQLAGRTRDETISNIPFDVGQDVEQPARGRDLVLTIDRDVQFWIESVLFSAVTNTGATGGTIIVMNPRNGDILGMASYPTFDPNAFGDVPNATVWRNPAIGEVYEPGSVFKILTMAAGLEAGVIAPQDTYVDSACVTYGGRQICNWDRAGHGTLDMTQILVQSLNVGVSWISVERLGPDRFYNQIALFGIGRRTGVDMQGEEAGILKVPGDPLWSESDLATNSFGQGVSVTPLQMITSAAAIANGGLMYQPRIVHQIIDGTEVYTAQPTVLGRPISPQTSALVTEMMVASVNSSPDAAQRINVPGYTIAGKTGTAEIPSPAGGYEANTSITTFIGFLPADDPQVIVLIKLDRPSGYWASLVLTPIFNELVSRLVLLLEIPPDNVRWAMEITPPGQ